jgi:hypothetical protein
MNEKRKRIGAAGWTVVALVLLPMLYVLSYGPVTWIVVNGMMPDWTGQGYGDFYVPLACAMAYWPSFGDLVSSYVRWWIGI